MLKQLILKPKFAFIIILIYGFLSGCNNNTNSFSPVTQQFQDSVKGENTVCLYPSTLKMLNTKNDSNLNEILKNIKKVKVVTYNKLKDSVKKIDIQYYAAKIKNENFVDLMQLKQNDKDIRVYLLKHHDKPAKLYGIISDSANVILIDLVGSIPINKLSALANGKTDLSGFSSILNFNRQNNKKKDKK
jgi:hypothetical protein